MEEYKKKFLNSNDYCCFSCGKRKKLHIHHVFPIKEYPNLMKFQGNLMFLCSTCHRRMHVLINKEGNLWWIKDKKERERCLDIPNKINKLIQKNIEKLKNLTHDKLLELHIDLEFEKYYKERGIKSSNKWICEEGKIRKGL